MKEPWQKMNCIKIDLTTTEDFVAFPKINKSKPSPCNSTTLFLLITMLFIGAIVMSYTLWKINFSDYSQPTLVLTNDEFKNLILSIVDEDFDKLFSQDGNDNKTSFLGEVQVLDNDYHVLWWKDLDDTNLRNLDKKIVSFDQKSKSKDKLSFEEDDYLWEDYDDDDSMIPSITPSSLPRNKRSNYVTSSPSSKPKKYVVSHQMRFVNCERFKPTPRGKYLVSPSLPALHFCYKNGVYLNELKLGLTRNQGGELRYDLANLYVACGNVFDENVDELTDDLRQDYERCKWSRALDSRQQAVIEHRFADRLGYAGQSQAPGQLQVGSTTTTSSTTTSSPIVTRLDPRDFVECNHVETELFEDYFESPSFEALQRCQKHGVTASQLEQGIGKNPKFNEIYFDVSSLYIPCSYVFDQQLDYMTSELKEDYRRCKHVNALSREAQQFIEKKFYEALDENSSSTEKSDGRGSTEDSSSYSTEDDYDSSYLETTTSPSSRYAFANCKRVEGAAYFICIKVIKVY